MQADRLDPLITAEAVTATYKRYIKTLITPRDPVLTKAFVSEVDATETLTRGPFLEMTPPYEAGATIENLIEEGVLHQGLRRLRSKEMPLDRALYRHQEQAVRKITAGRNVVVTTGTGSGKTESFLIPILNTLLTEHAEGKLGPGVRALLLYPMNALANDQVKRLRALLKETPEITFGRYTGETKHGADEAESLFRSTNLDEPRLPNELLSREEMRTTPPHILLTNYAMLEYLLLRPGDIDLFEGEHSGNWRFIALDEAHVYDGAQGSEVGLLLRRLRDRVARGSSIQCIATSASLDGEPAEVMRFASSLFGEPFEYEPADSSRQDLVLASRVKRREAPSWGPMSDRQLFELADPALSDSERVHSLAKAAGITDPVDALHEEQLISDLRAILARGPQAAKSVCTEMWPGDTDGPKRLEALVALGSAVRDASGVPVLSARYHMFVRATEGAFSCFSASGPHVQLSRHETCPDCGKACFEFGTCKGCGAVYLAGEFEQRHHHEFFVPTRRPDSQSAWILLSDEDDVVDEDDQTLDVIESDDRTGIAWLCTGCGHYSKSHSAACPVPGCEGGELRSVRKHEYQKKELRTCTACGGRSAQKIRRLHLGQDAPPAVLATALYQALPPSSDRSVDLVGQGRKLLMFSDSRQAAAYAAPYLDGTYRQLLERRYITMVLEDPNYSNLDLTVDDLTRLVAARATEQGHFAETVSGLSRRAEAATWVMSELLALDMRQSLEGVGVLRLSLKRPSGVQLPPPLLAAGLAEDEAWDLLQELADTIRLQGAITMANDVDPKDERFEPRTGPIFVRENGADRKKKIISWMPTRGSNRRIDYLGRVLRELGATMSATDALAGCWRFLLNGAGWFRETRSASVGTAYQTDHSKILMTNGLGATWYECNRCRRITPRSVRGICTSMRCEGRLVPFTPPTLETDENHYRYVYRTLRAAPLAAKEHTAQWNAIEAADIQHRFVAGEVNVLSCSTTFELGVDVGDLQSVVMRNMPPKTANYVQRAGRAGRRAGAAALVLTYAQRRSHDLTKFQDPITMIAGQMRVPWVPIDNERIGRRHAHSVALASFWAHEKQTRGAEWSTVGDFFGNGHGIPSVVGQLERYLSPVPQHITDALSRILPPKVSEEIDANGEGWAAKLIVLLKSIESEIHNDVREFQALIDTAVKQENYRAADQLKKTLKTIQTRQLIGFLARRNVLPKYGFPVDTVELRTLHSGDPVGRQLELSRDLTQAIYDYAPGNDVVAGGKLWTTRGIYRLPGKELDPHDYSICPDCDRFESARLLERTTEPCPCGSTRPRKVFKYIVPEFGFLSDRKPRPVGAAPPDRRWYGSTHVQDLGDEISDEVWTSPKGVDVHIRSGARATMVAVSEGPAKGFFVCDWCGWSAPKTAGRRTSAKHDRPLTGEPCQKTGIAVYSLAHRYQTDIAEFTFDGIVFAIERTATWMSALYALLEGASERLEISRDDIDATLSWSSRGRRSLVLFDTVPGGAGAAKLIAKDFQGVLHDAYKRVSKCDCGIETSCYGCLRSHRNARHHDLLSRSGALELLTLIGATAEGADLSPDWASQLEYVISRKLRETLAAVASFGVPAPAVGEEVGDPKGVYWPIEALWADHKVAVVDDDIEDRENWLRDHGFTVLRGDIVSAREIAAALETKVS